MEKFDKNHFDVVHAQNTLDHSYDIIQCFAEMIAATKPNGLIVMQHYANEGTNENWVGFHQWDFFIDDKGLKVKKQR